MGGYRDRMQPAAAPLVVSLPAGFRARSGTAADAGAYLAIVQRVDLACCGESTSTLEECLDDITSPTLDAQRGSVVIEGAHGTVVAVMNCFNELAHGRGLFADTFIDPQLDAPVADALADALVAAARAYAAAIASTLPGIAPLVKTGLYANDRAFRGALERAGFEQHRVHWRMRIDHAAVVQPVPLPAGVTLRGHTGDGADWATAHSVLNAAFADYYDFHPRPFDVWLEEMTSAIHSIELWGFACIDGLVVGACVRNLRYASNGFGYIAGLGVLREHRGRGIAKALLADAFAADARAGLSGTLLHGDSTNPTGAMRLYEQMGMRADREYLAYRLGS